MVRTGSRSAPSCRGGPRGPWRRSGRHQRPWGRACRPARVATAPPRPLRRVPRVRLDGPPGPATIFIRDPLARAVRRPSRRRRPSPGGDGRRLVRAWGGGGPGSGGSPHLACRCFSRRPRADGWGDRAGIGAEFGAGFGAEFHAMAFRLAPLLPSGGGARRLRGVDARRGGLRRRRVVHPGWFRRRPRVVDRSAFRRRPRRPPPRSRHRMGRRRPRRPRTRRPRLSGGHPRRRRLPGMRVDQVPRDDNRTRARARTRRGTRRRARHPEPDRAGRCGVVGAPRRQA